MYGNWGYGMGFGFGWIFTIIFWGLLIWGGLSLIHWFNRDGKGGCCGGHGVNEKKNSAMDILNERYAKGEIDKDEYETKKKDLN